jgi:hypothetical protein
MGEKFANFAIRSMGKGKFAKFFKFTHPLSALFAITRPDTMYRDPTLRGYHPMLPSYRILRAKC